tara:strand:- start:233 stop:394 length:162 start_codon:yes stop_codon:yes gene_type:complete
MKILLLLPLLLGFSVPAIAHNEANSAYYEDTSDSDEVGEEEGKDEEKGEKRFD